MKTQAGKKKTLRENVLFGLKQKEPASIGFRMLPMVDVLFLLLIFFIFTANFRPQENFLPFQLPAASAQPIAGSVEPLPLIIVTTPRGCYIQIGHAENIELLSDSLDSNLAYFSTQFTAVMKSQKRNQGDPVELICDASVKWEYIAKIYNVLYGMKITDITFRMTQPI